jgi:hypothetical protein
MAARRDLVLEIRKALLYRIPVVSTPAPMRDRKVSVVIGDPRNYLINWQSRVPKPTVEMDISLYRPVNKTAELALSQFANCIAHVGSMIKIASVSTPF